MPLAGGNFPGWSNRWRAACGGGGSAPPSGRARTAATWARIWASTRPRTASRARCHVYRSIFWPLGPPRRVAKEGKGGGGRGGGGQSAEGGSGEGATKEGDIGRPGLGPRRGDVVDEELDGREGSGEVGDARSGA